MAFLFEQLEIAENFQTINELQKIHYIQEIENIGKMAINSEDFYFQIYEFISKNIRDFQFALMEFLPFWFKTRIEMTNTETI